MANLCGELLWINWRSSCLNRFFIGDAAMFIALIFLPIISAIICGAIAKRRNAKASFWVLMGLIFSLFAIPFVFFARPQQEIPPDDV